MSHQPERKEKDCLNCGTIVHARYCHICGQENIQTRQGFWSLTRHFIYDIFHFDGKFFDSLKYLFTKPGYIPAEYIKGRRQSFLDPIRMYLFTSAIFFLVFFALKDPGTAIIASAGDLTLSQERRVEMAADLIKDTLNSDNGKFEKINLLLDTSKSVGLLPVSDTDNIESKFLIFKNNRTYILQGRDRANEIKVDSTDWLSKSIADRYRRYKRSFGDDFNAMLSDFSSRIMHKLPYILFVSLPVFALILKLLYLRRKKYLYADHVVITLYHYILAFILLLLFFILEAIAIKTQWDFLEIIGMVLILSIEVYLLVAMKRFYGQRFGKTFLKFILLNLLAFISLMFILTIFVIFSIFQL